MCSSVSSCTLLLVSVATCIIITVQILPRVWCTLSLLLSCLAPRASFACPDFAACVVCIFLVACLVLYGCSLLPLICYWIDVGRIQVLDQFCWLLRNRVAKTKLPYHSLCGFDRLNPQLDSRTWPHRVAKFSLDFIEHFVEQHFVERHFVEQFDEVHAARGVSWARQ